MTSKDGGKIDIAGANINQRIWINPHLPQYVFPFQCNFVAVSPHHAVSVLAESRN